MLKGKWRRLRYLYMLLLKSIPDVIITAYCLLNMCIKLGNVDEDVFHEEDEDDAGEEDENMMNVIQLLEKQKDNSYHIFCLIL
jgi:hypothetical protein